MSQSIIVICPGIHSPQLTASFVEGIQSVIEPKNHLILPTEKYLPYCAITIIQWLETYYSSPQDAPELSFLSFSAGVVGSIVAANLWQLQGGKVKSFIAFDGWGMPLWGNFPIHRVSHDFFTHYTSAIVDARESFYADPEIEHLELWRSPNTCSGWRIISPGLKTRCSLWEYLYSLMSN